ncbi:MAG: type II toxin-antitoxin system RelE/ParE family toxin, partial [Lentisphaerota bacterium]
MVYKVVYARLAEKYLDGLAPKERARILKKIGAYVASGNPMQYAGKLKVFTIPTYRFRIGDYRVI